uniref:Uncharacterized protein n=1 Tax=Bathycoccus sp. RCC716 virus 2 TaxID=2530039 RepID=A0A7S6SX76_9PHYC|nr:hypothetical protein [Bathycoccus sp. RCC716 virus 2]|tara:strand:- start:4094 stop:4591 length:498 start_codon:yes stop_codon:yes gene_type:complete
MIKAHVLTNRNVLLSPRVKLSKRNKIIRNTSDSDYSDQTFDDVNTMLVKYFTFRSLQYTMGQVYLLDTSLMKLEFNWLCDFANNNKPSSGDPFIEALYDEGKPELANRIMANRDGLMREWLHEITATGGLDLGIEMTKHNMEVSRKQLDRSFNATLEPSKSVDEV